MSRTLIVGNLGYIGPTVVEECMRVSDVDGLDAGWFVGKQLSDDRIGARPETQFLWDLRDISPEFLAEYDSVVCLGAVSNDPIGNNFESATEEINNFGTRALIRSAKESGVSNFVFASSCSTYGSAGDVPRKESDPLNPLTAYARSKVAIEEYLSEMHNADFKCTALRFATACGVSRHPRLDLVLNDFVASGLAYNRVMVLSDGSPQRPLIAVTDMARAIAYVVNGRSNLGSEMLILNAGYDEWNFTVRQLAEVVTSEMNLAEPHFASDGGPDKRSYSVDFSRSRSLEGWPEPANTINQTVNDLALQYADLGIDETTYQNREFRRLTTLEDLITTGTLDSNLRITS